MAKPDFPALLPPGVHILTLPQLHAVAVAPFAGDARRKDLFDKLLTWTSAVGAAGVKGTLWLDGSYLTQKNCPDDIDCILWSPFWVTPESDTPANRNIIKRLFDRSTARAIYGLDFYTESPGADELFGREAYWRGVLGFAHDRVTAKGFAEVSI